MTSSRQERGPLRVLVAVLAGIAVFLGASVQAQAPADSAAPEAEAATEVEVAPEAEAAPPSTPEEILEAKHQKVRELLYAGSYDEAEAISREGLAEAEAVWGEGALESAKFLDAALLARMGNGKVRGEEGDETVALGLRAVEIREDNDAEPADLAWALRNLADLYRRRDENETASRTVGRAIEILREAGGMETTLGARLLNLQGLCERRLGNLELAKSLFEESAALHLAVTGEVGVLRATTLSNLAGSLQRMGDLSAALEVYREALDVAERVHGEGHLRTAGVMGNYSVALSENGDLDEARRVAEQALAIVEKALRPDHPYVGTTMEKIAIYSSELGDAEAALEMGRRVLEITEASEGAESSRAVRVLTSLATFAQRGGRPELAAEYYERGVAVGEALENPEPKALSEVYRLYGEFLQDQGRGDEAERRYRDAIVWAEKDPRLRYVSRARSVRDLGLLYVERGEFARAMPYLEEARADLQASQGASHPSIASVLYSIGLAQQGLGLREAAMASAVESHEVRRRHLLDTVNALPETMALRYVSKGSPSMDLALSLLIEDPSPEAADTVREIVVQRALVLDELARRNRVLAAAADPALAEEIERYRSIRERFAHRTLADPGDATPEEHLRELAELERAKNESERKLAEAGLGRGAAGGVVSAREVREALPPKGALVSFVRYDVHRGGRRGGSSYAALVTRAGETGCDVVDLGDAPAVEANVSGWWTAAAWGGRGTRGIVQMGAGAGDQLADYRKAGRELRERVWDPVAPWLEGAERIFLVPDGELHRVSFAALPNDDETYLLETVPVLHLLSAERSLMGVRGATGSGGMLAIGGPDFEWSGVDATEPSAEAAPATGSGLRGSRSLREGLASLEFTSLEGAGREATDVAGIWRAANGNEAGEDVVLLTGPAADERAFKRNAPGRSVLHLATHGFFLAPAGEDPPGAGDPRELQRTEAELIRENPLLLSGLALAGANRRGEGELPGGEDGIVTAEEIAVLDLSGVEWAVLSACETGVGTVRTGEGVFGLRRAFEVAGAATIVTSLWSVDDEATRAWMDALYRARFVDGLATDEAVRAASLTCLRDLRGAGRSDHPFRWAAFVAAGDWR